MKNIISNKEKIMNKNLNLNDNDEQKIVININSENTFVEKNKSKYMQGLLKAHEERMNNKENKKEMKNEQKVNLVFTTKNYEKYKERERELYSILINPNISYQSKENIETINPETNEISHINTLERKEKQGNEIKAKVIKNSNEHKKINKNQIKDEENLEAKKSKIQEMKSRYLHRKREKREE